MRKIQAKSFYFTRQEQPFRKLSKANLLDFTQSTVGGPLFPPWGDPWYLDVLARGSWSRSLRRVLY